jgi:hypothetical protein
MSEITYTLRSPKLIKNVLVELEKPGTMAAGIGTPMVTKVHARVASMSFLYQPLRDFWRGDEYNERFFRIQARLEKLWVGIGKEDVPMFVAFTDSKKGHKVEVGQDVCYFTNKQGDVVDDHVPFEHYTGNYEYIKTLGKIVKVY